MPAFPHEEYQGTGFGQKFHGIGKLNSRDADRGNISGAK
jgi:hypothetical protein